MATLRPVRVVLILAALAVLPSFVVAGMVAGTIHYQGRIVDGAGQPVAGPVDIEIGIWDSASGGDLRYQEHHLATPLVGSVFDLYIGTGSDPTGDLDAQTFSGAERWIQLSVGGTTLAPRQPFSSVAYALHSDRADFATTAAEVAVITNDGAARALVQRLPPGAGFVATRGPGDRNNTRLTYRLEDADLGFVAVDDAAGGTRATLQVLGDGEGFANTLGPSGAENVRLTANAGDADRGFVSVDNEEGSSRAQLSTLPAGEGFAAVRGPSGFTNVRLTAASSNPNLGFIAVDDANGATRAQMNVSSSSDAGFAGTRGPNGFDNARLTFRTDDAELGAVDVLDAKGVAMGRMHALGTGEGFVATGGPNGKGNVNLEGTFFDRNIGELTVRDPRGFGVLDVTASSVGGDGFLFLWDPTGEINVVFGGTAEDPNRGEIVTFDASGEERAGIRINEQGKGEIFADVKNFIVTHPEQPDTRITYSSLEGPEVGIYHRGVFALSRGAAHLTLPPHFVALASPGSVTMQLTPASFASLGIGCVIQNNREIEVRELRGGRGSYDVHFVAHAVRRPYEDFEPVGVADEHGKGASRIALERQAERSSRIARRAREGRTP